MSFFCEHFSCDPINQIVQQREFLQFTTCSSSSSSSILDIMSSVSGIVQAASTTLNGGIIAAIVIASLLGFAALVGFIICMYCLCCRKSKKHRGVIIQPATYPTVYPQPSPYPAAYPQAGSHSGGYNQAPAPHPTSTNKNIPVNKVW